MDSGAEISDSSREAGPSGMQIQNRGVSHNCQGPRCVCQRYENGELAAVIMNQGRSNQEREDGYQNANHISRAFQNRLNNSTLQIHPNLNPNYQNPIDLIRNCSRRLQQPQQQQQQQEPEENIYERLDNDDDEDDDESAEIPRNESLTQSNQSNMDNHMYERIGERISCSNRAHCHYYKYHVPAHSFFNDMESARNVNQYDQPKHIYIDYSRLNSNIYQSSLNRLGRNCFSTENIAYASTKRSFHPIMYNCTCPYCRNIDTRYICHHCYNLYNRLRYQDISSRHYAYQISRNCRCPFCRGEYLYTKLPATELLKMEYCHCRNPTNCICRSKTLSNLNSTIVGRYLDWINRTGQSVNNPLYAMIHVGRMDRASMSGNTSNSGNLPNGIDPGPSTSSNTTSNVRFNEPSSSSVLRSIFALNTSTSNVPVCSISRYAEHHHTCDDSCIRNQNDSLTGICQLLGRCDRTECNHGRLSIHWWFVNKWLPLWNSHNHNMDGASYVDEISREQRESDSDD